MDKFGKLYNSGISRHSVCTRYRGENEKRNIQKTRIERVQNIAMYKEEHRDKHKQLLGGELRKVV